MQNAFVSLIPKVVWHREAFVCINHPSGDAEQKCDLEGKNQ